MIFNKVENLTLDEKMELFDQFNETFGKIMNFDSDNILSMFTIEELLDPKFETEIVPKLYTDRYYRYENYELAPLISILENRRVYSYFREKATPEELKKFLGKVYRLLSEGKLPIDNISSFRILSNNKEDFMNLIIENKEVTKFLSDECGFVKGLVDEYLTTTDSYANVKSFYDEFSTAAPWYVNYPLVIINDNLTNNEKVKMIKKTYRQKDITKYMAFIKDKITNLDHLDAFIEATIIQNNRVRVKNKRVAEIMRRIFIGMRSDYGTTDFTKYTNAENFRTKFNPYLDRSSLRELLSAVSSGYEIKKNFYKFVLFMFKNDTIEENLARAEYLPGLGDQLFSEPLTVLNDQVKGNEEREYLFFNYLSGNNTFMKMHGKLGAELMPYLIRYPEMFINKINKEVSYFSGGISSWNLDQSLNELKEILQSLPDEIMTQMSVGAESLKKTLYLGSSGYGIQDNIIKLKRIFKDVDDIIAKKPSYKEVIERDFVELFRDEEFLNDNVLQGVSNLLLNEYRAMDRLKSSFKTQQDDLAIEAYIKLFKDFISKYYPNEEDALRNLDKLTTDLQLLVSL